MFDGKIGSRTVNFGGSRREPEKKSAKALAEESKRQREQRAQQKILTDAAVKIQKCARRQLTWRKSMNGFRALFDKRFNDIRNLKTVFAAKRSTFNVPLAAIDSILQSFLFFYSPSADSGRFLLLIDLMLESVSHQIADFNYLTSLVSSTKWDVSLEKFDNIRLIRLKKLSVIGIRCILSMSKCDAAIKFVSIVTSSNGNSPADQFVKTILCCLLCDEAVRCLQSATTSKEDISGRVECLMSMVQYTITCINPPWRSEVPWQTAIAYREV